MTEIEKYLKARPFIVKFGTKKNIESLLNGCLYMKCARYFQELGTDSHQGRGDIYEGKHVFSNTWIKVNGKRFNNINYSMASQADERTPIFCASLLDEKHIMPLSNTSGNVIFDEKTQNEFGDYVLFCDFYSFINRVMVAAKQKGILFRHGKVMYFDYENDNTIFGKGINIFFLLISVMLFCYGIYYAFGKSVA